MTKGLFSVIVAVYNVSDYIESFFKSLEKQSFPLEDLDIVMVDDGSTDDSYSLVKRWAEKYPGAVRHATQSNGGPAAARNVALGMVKNKWVTVVDPDDAVQPDYFQRVEEFLLRDKESKAVMLSTRMLIWQEETGRISPTHPLDIKYKFGDRLVDLNEEPNNIQLAGNSAFLLNSIIRENNLRQDTRIRPTFEDGAFIGRYLGIFPRQIVGIVSSARYMYRKRGDGSSLVQSSWSKASRYDDVIRFGYIPMLQALRERLGYVPVWAQNTVLYDIQWYLTEDRKYRGGTGWLSEVSLEVFQSLMIELFSYIDRKSIELYNVTSLTWVFRQALLVRFKGTGLRPTTFVRWSPAGTEGLIKLGYGFYGEQPKEEVTVDGRTEDPVHAKSIYHNFFGQTYFVERVLWVSGPGVANVWLDGYSAKSVGASRPGWAKPKTQKGELKLAPSINSGPKRPVTSGFTAKAKSLISRLDNRSQIEQIRSNVGPATSLLNVAKRNTRRKLEQRSLEARKNSAANVVRWSMSDECKMRYADAWLVMDRVSQAGDNGEHLYRHLMNDRPEINAYFVLSRASSDWDRLFLEGFRLIEYGSDECIALSLNSIYKISSDATYDVQYPADPNLYGRDSAKIIFLQHGITQHDLSAWLNPKQISLMITATPDEHESIAGDGSPYKYTGKETTLTGFPRFDRLYRKSNGESPLAKTRLLVMPTWRQELKDLLVACSSGDERSLVFEGTEYGRSWLAVLNDPAIINAAEEQGLQLTFLAHPSLEEFVDDLTIPDHVQILRHRDVLLQDVLIESKVVVTDYSSIAFDAAYTGSTLFYYQFDYDTVFSGSHSFRPGYYDYSKHGFGKVSIDLEGLVGDVVASSGKGFERDSEFELVVENTFAFRDANNCARVVLAIESLSEDY